MPIWTFFCPQLENCSSMFKFSMLLQVVAASLLVLLSGTYAAIRPSSDLHIVNKFLQPDGFNHSFVSAEFVIEVVN